MSARRNSGGAQPPFADCPVHGLLADTQQARRFSRADKSSPLARGRDRAGVREPVNVLELESAVSSRGHGGGPQLAACHGAKNGRSADAKAGC